MTNHLIDQYWAPFLILVMVGTIAWGWLDGRRQRRVSRERYAKSLEEYHNQLRNPDWIAFGESVPAALIELYRNKQLIIQEDLVPSDVPDDLEGFCSISEFHPVNQSNMMDFDGKLHFALAGNALGDLFVMPLEECDKESGPVYFYKHEDSKMHLLANDLRDFIRGLKPLEEE